MQTYMTEQENFDDLASRIPPHDRAGFSACKSSHTEAGFYGRRLVLYKPTGVNSQNQHRPPNIVTILRVNDFYCDDDIGAEVSIFDTVTGESMAIDHIPNRLFDYDVFAHIPPMFNIRWDARNQDDEVTRSLVYPIRIFTKNRSSCYSANVSYLEPMSRFREFYPGVKINLQNR